MSQIPTLDGVQWLGVSTTGFSYPQNAQIIPILGDGTTPGGNAVMQAAALGFRQASLSGYVEDSADVTALYAAAASHDEVTFVDFEGASTQVRILDFTATAAGNALWSCTATLIEVVGS